MEEKREGLLPNLLPQVGMEFGTFDEAWMFWIRYGGQKGFEVRKMYTNKRKDGNISSCRFVCANEGHRKPDKRDHLTKCPRAETRTDCQVRMGLIMDKNKENYKVTDLFLEHNHALQLPETSHLMVTQRRISELQGFEIETADDAGMGPKAAPGLAREARSTTVHDNQGRNIIENPKLAEMLRYKDMSLKFQHLAHRAASHPNCCLLVHNALDMVSKQVEEELNGVASPVDPVIAPTNVSLPTELLNTARLKKKEVETKTSKRIKAWYEKKRKYVARKKGGINIENITKVCDKKKEKKPKVSAKKKQKCSKDQETIQVMDDDGATVQMSSLPEEGIFGQYLAISSFSELLKGSMTDDVIGEF